MASTPEPAESAQPPAGLSEELARLTSENEGLRVELQEARTNNQRYLQNVAHQLTAPLGAIKWSIEALKNPEIPSSCGAHARL